MDNTEHRAKQIFGAIGLVVGVVILIAISALIVGSILLSSVFTDTVTTGNGTNETLSAVDNVTTSSFAIRSTFPNAVCSLSNVYNATGGGAIGAANYTQPETCQILAVDGSEFLGEDWNVTYTYTNTQSNTAGLNVTLLTGGFSAFVLGIVTFLGIIGIIIGIVWLISYLRPLFSKDEGIQSFAGN